MHGLLIDMAVDMRAYKRFVCNSKNRTLIALVNNFTIKPKDEQEFHKNKSLLVGSDSHEKIYSPLVEIIRAEKYLPPFLAMEIRPDEYTELNGYHFEGPAYLHVTSDTPGHYIRFITELEGNTNFKVIDNTTKVMPSDDISKVITYGDLLQVIFFNVYVITQKKHFEKLIQYERLPYTSNIRLLDDFKKNNRRLRVPDFTGSQDFTNTDMLDAYILVSIQQMLNQINDNDNYSFNGLVSGQGVTYSNITKIKKPIMSLGLVSKPDDDNPESRKGFHYTGHLDRRGNNKK